MVQRRVGVDDCKRRTSGNVSTQDGPRACLGNGTCSYYNVLQRVLKEGLFPWLEQFASLIGPRRRIQTPGCTAVVHARSSRSESPLCSCPTLLLQGQLSWSTTVELGLVSCAWSLPLCHCWISYFPQDVSVRNCLANEFGDMRSVGPTSSHSVLPVMKVQPRGGPQPEDKYQGVSNVSVGIVCFYCV
jgi:hypothetical protein